VDDIANDEVQEYRNKLVRKIALSLNRLGLRTFAKQIIKFQWSIWNLSLTR
jgi:hypothetical protein